VAVAGWLVDNSAAARAHEPAVGTALRTLGRLYLCQVGALEQLYSARSAREYDQLLAALQQAFEVVEAPADLLARALRLQQDLAHRHRMWHRTPIPDLLIAETALHHGLGVVCVDADFERIAAVRPLEVRRLSAG
jgi:predicted nucleic acid-binding protein